MALHRSHRQRVRFESGLSALEHRDGRLAVGFALVGRIVASFFSPEGSALHAWLAGGIFVFCHKPQLAQALFPRPGTRVCSG